MALKFDKETAALLNRFYDGRDVRARRKANRDALAPLPGEVIVDIGSGAGHLAEELARAGTKVLAVDPSEAMHAAAAERCAELDGIDFLTGTAEALPVADGAADGAVSIQVFEYLDDIPAALAEAARVLRPGGRLVVGDMHYGAFVWATEHPDRHDRIVDLWNDHFATPVAPELVRPAMTEAGFRDIVATAETFTDIDLRADGIARMMLILLENYAANAGEPDLAAAWRAEQEARAREGRFFFSMTHFILRGTRA